MLRGSAWAARRDQAFALVEDPQQRHLADWREQRTRRRAELEEKTARRQAEFTALIPAIAAQVAAEVSAAVAAALRTTHVGHHEGLVHVPTTTSASTTSVADNHDLAAPTPSTCSTICLAGDTSADLAASAPTTCSVELPSHAASVYAAALTPSSAEPTSSTTTACVSEQCCFDPEPVVAILTPTSAPDLLECVDDLSSTSPSVGLSLWSSGGIGTAALLSVKVFTVHKLIGVLLPATEIKRPPWPPPWFVSFQDVIRCKDMLQALLLDDFVLWSMQLMLWAGKYRWPPPTPNRSTCCRILNLHSTLDKDMQLSIDCQVLKICELKCSTVPIVVTFVPGYKKAQLKPTLSKWLIPSCLGRQLLGSSTLDFLLARRAAHIVWNWCCFDYLHCYLDSTNCALQEEHRQVLLQIHWQSVGYHWEAAYPMKPCSAIDKLFIIEHWLIPWEPGDGSPGRNHMENLTSLVTTCVLLYSISLDEKLLIGRYWLWWMKCVELPGVRPGAYFSLPGVNKGKLKWYNIFYASNSCWNGWHSLWLLIHWLHMPCLHIFWGLLCAVQGHVCSSTRVFLANLNGESEVQHQYACTRVLTVTVGTVWIYHYIVGGNTHYSVLMQCSVSHPKLQSEFRFYTAGHILFFCCALVQWKIPWTICLVSLRYWFQCCHAACDSWEEFYSSIQIGKLPGLLVQLVQLKPWPSWELFSCIAAVIRCLLRAFHIFTSSVFILKDIYSISTHYLEVHICDASAVRLRSSSALTCFQGNSENLSEFKFNETTREYSSFLILMFEGASCYDSARFAWKIAWLRVGTSCACSDFEGSEHVTSKCTPPDILLHNWLSCLMGHIIQCGFDLVLWKIAWSLILECLKITRRNPKELLLLHVGEISQANFIVSCYWLAGNAAWFRFCTRFKHARSYFLVDVKHNTKDMNSWDYPIPSADCSLYSLASVSELLDIIYAGINTLQNPWDPGACSSFAQRRRNPEGLNDACSNTPNALIQMPWDPGGFHKIGLGASRILWRGDCQRPIYKSGPMGCHLGQGQLGTKIQRRLKDIYTYRATTGRRGLD